MSSEGYYGAAVCRRGHILTRMIEPGEPRAEPIPEKCFKCGAPVLTACPSCRHRLRGLSRSGYPSLSKDEPVADEFCDKCGHPMPWASRESIVMHVENLLEDEPNLAEGDRRALEERLRALRESTAEAGVEKRQVDALTMFQKVAPKAWQLAVPLLDAVLTAKMRQVLNLPPA